MRSFTDPFLLRRQSFSNEQPNSGPSLQPSVDVGGLKLSSGFSRTTVSGLVRALLPKPIRPPLRRAQFALTQLLWRHVHPTIRLASGIDIQVLDAAEWMAFCEVFVLGEYNDAIKLLIDHGPTRTLVLDLGANVGYFSLKMLDCWIASRGSGDGLDIVAIEGATGTFSRLQSRLKSPAAARIRAYHGLVGRREGAAHINERADHISASLFGEPSSGHTVPFIDLVNLLPKDQRIGLLKCDIEGAEEEFLKSYPDLLARTDAMVIEIHGSQCDRSECLERILGYGFRHERALKRWQDLTVDLFTR